MRLTQQAAIAFYREKMSYGLGARSDGFELLQVVQVVSSHGFDHDLKGHFAAFGVSERFRKHLRSRFAD